jgi:hypothetical protein
LRDADETDVSAAVRFSPAALLNGSVSVAYSDFAPKSESIPNFKGATLAANLSYAVRETTKADIRAERAIRYSFDAAQPYYLQTGFTAELTQQIYGPVDLVGRGGAANLDYRDRAGAAVLEANRSDRVVTYGGGVGYHLANSLRIGFNADQIRRDSAVPSRQYERLTYGASLTYDF